MLLDSIAIHARHGLTARCPRRRGTCSRVWWTTPAELGGARPRDLGGPGRAEALHGLQGPVLGGAGPRGEARRGPRRSGEAERWPRWPTRSRPRSASRRRRARRVHPALRHRRARRLAPAHPADGIPAAGRRARPQDRPGDRRRADQGRAGAALPREHTDDGLEGEEGTFTICSFWLVRPSPRSARPNVRGRCARSCSRSPARCSCTPRRSTLRAAATSATSRRRSPISPGSTRVMSVIRDASHQGVA